VELSLIQDERLLLLQPGQRTRQIVDAVLNEYHIQATNTLCTSNIRVILGLVSEGYGLSFLFDSHLRSQEDRRSICCFRFGSTPIRRDFVAASRAGSYLPHYAYDFIEIAKEVVSAESPEASTYLLDR
jgi:DNA-binding transcriptional LysR family regulator